MIHPISVPNPMVVTITSDPVSPIQPVTLTCTADLSPAVNVQVIVNTEWTGPDGFMTTNTAQPVMGSTTTYTCLLYTSPSPRDATLSRMPSSA